MELSKTDPEPYDISIQSTIIQMWSFPTISFEVTTVADTFANQNEGSAYICRYSWISGESNVCNLEQ